MHRLQCGMLFCNNKSTLREWVNQHTNITWGGKGGMRDLFIKRVTPPDYEEKIKKKLITLKNTSLDNVHVYFQQFLRYVSYLDWGMKNPSMINLCEQNLCNEVKVAL